MLSSSEYLLLEVPIIFQGKTSSIFEMHQELFYLCAVVSFPSGFRCPPFVFLVGDFGSQLPPPALQTQGDSNERKDT